MSTALTVAEPRDLVYAATNEPWAERIYLQSGCQLTNDDCSHLRRFHRLTHVSLNGSTTTGDAGVAHLEHHASSLVMLDLSGTAITSKATTATVTKCVGLERLDVSITHVDDSGLPPLGLLTKLTFLNVSGTAVTAAGLSSLPRLQKLQELRLAFLDLAKKGTLHVQQYLQYLRQLPDLTVLCLRRAVLNNSCLPVLAQSQGLTVLDISYNDGFTSHGVQHLRHLTQLTRLITEGTSISATDRANLEQSLGGRSLLP